MQDLTQPSTELSLRAQQDAFLGFPASRRVGERGTQERFIRGGAPSGGPTLLFYLPFLTEKVPFGIISALPLDPTLNILFEIGTPFLVKKILYKIFFKCNV